MPKKSRTPPPPKRPVQAPRARADSRTPRDRRTLFVAALAAAVVLAAAAVGIAFAVRGGGDGGGETELPAAMAGTGCELVEEPAQEANHVEELPEDFEYNTSPPSSGPHHPQPVIWNAYDDPVDQLMLVHNLEHGGISVQYGEDVPPETAQRLLEWYRVDPNGVVLAPLPELGSEIALAAWTARGEPITDETERVDPGDLQEELGHVMTCPRFDEEAFTAFRETFRFRGPEAFPPSFLAPGSQ